MVDPQQLFEKNRGRFSQFRRAWHRACSSRARARSMTQMRFYDAASGLLTPEAFSFMVTTS